MFVQVCRRVSLRLALMVVLLIIGQGLALFRSSAAADPSTINPHALGDKGVTGGPRTSALANSTCTSSGTEAGEIKKHLIVQQGTSRQLRIGDDVRLSWGIGALDIQSPAYLIVAVDRLSRFNSMNAIALTPEARAPFDIKQFKGSTRLVIPLHVPGAPRQGEIIIHPLMAEQTQVEIGIVGVGACGEVRDQNPVRFTVDVQPGRPEIVLASRFDLAAAEQVIVSPRGDRFIEVVGARYRLVEKLSGAVLADDAGQGPRFSPNGRFMTAQQGHRIQVRDTVDGRLVSRGTDLSTDPANDDLIWGDHDSFLAGAGQKDGIFLLVNPLNDQGFFFASAGLCRVPMGILNSIRFKVDLEQNIMVTTCKNGHRPFNVQGLSSDYKFDTVYRNAYARSMQAPKLSPDGWELVEGTVATQTSTQYGSAKPTTPHLNYLGPTLMTSSDSILEGVPEPFHAASQRENAAYLLDRKRILARLREFGLEVNEGLRFQYSSVSKPEEPSRATALRVAGIRVDTRPSVWFEEQQCGEIKVLQDKMEIAAPGEQELGVHSLVDETVKLTIVSGRCQVGKNKDLTYPHAALLDSRYPSVLLNLRGKEFDRLMFGGVVGGYCEMSLYACGFVAELFQHRYLVISSQRSSAIAIYDLEKRVLDRVVYGLPSPELMIHVSLSQDLEHLLKIDRDGSFQLIELPAGQVSVSGNQTDVNQDAIVNQLPFLLLGRVSDDEVTLWTPSGRFDTTAEGATQIAVRFPGRNAQFVLEQLSPYLRAPNLLTRIMDGERFSEPTFEHIPPVLAVNASFSPTSVDVRLEPSQLQSVDEVRVYQDGVLTDTLNRQDGSWSAHFAVNRRFGARWVTFLARDRSKLFSAPVTFDAGQTAGARRRLHIVAVGVDHYQDPRVPTLQNAASDAGRFLQSLNALQAGGDYEIVSSALLIDAEAGKDTLFKRVSAAIAAAQPGDGVIVYVAGHGLVGPDGRYYLATPATKVDAIAQTSVPWDDLSQILSRAKTRVTMFLDTCQSGTAGTSFFATNDNAAQAMLDRVPSGILIFSASKGRELAEEQDAVGGGVFTGALVEALGSAETDLNRNGAIEASELYARVKALVVSATRGRQTPWFARNEMLGDMPPF